MPDPADFLPHAPRGWYRLALMALFFVMGLAFGSWAARIPDVRAALALTDADLGAALFGAPAGSMAAIAPAAWIIGRIGGRAAIVASMTITSLTLVSLGVAPDGVALFLCLFAHGFANNVLNISLNSQAVGVEILYRRSIISAFHGMWSLGGVAGGVLGAVLASLDVGPSAHFRGVCALMICAVVICRPALPPRDIRRRDAGRGEAGGTPGGRIDPFLILLGFVALAGMAVEGTMYDWNAVYFADVVRPDAALVRAGFVACMTAMVTGRMLGDGMVNARGPVFVLRCGGACIAAGMGMLLLLPHLPTAVLGSALTGFGMASMVPICYSLAGRHGGMSAQAGIALVSSISQFGFLACPPLIGFLSHALNLRLALAPVACMGAVIFVLAGLLPRLRR